jgi:hypothetical protein
LLVVLLLLKWFDVGKKDETNQSDQDNAETIHMKG